MYIHIYTQRNKEKKKKKVENYAVFHLPHTQD